MKHKSELFETGILFFVGVSWFIGRCLFGEQAFAAKYISYRIHTATIYGVPCPLNGGHRVTYAVHLVNIPSTKTPPPVRTLSKTPTLFQRWTSWERDISSATVLLNLCNQTRLLTSPAWSFTDVRHCL